MTDATQKQNRIIPNAYQSPNFYVDDLLPLLTGEEWKCISFVVRKTLGWQKRKDRLAKSVIASATGISETTVDKCMKNLIKFGLIRRTEEKHTGAHDGSEYEIQTEDEKINWEELEDRKQKLSASNKKRTVAARKSLKITPSVAQPPSVGQPIPPSVRQPIPPSVGQPTQKTIKGNKSLGENSPAHAPQKKGDMMDGILHYAALAVQSENKLADRVQEYPPDVQQTLIAFTEVFELLPSSIPTKPARESKGGSFAQWINELREVNAVLDGYGREGLAAAKSVCKDLSISHPGAIMWALPAEVGKLAKRKSNNAAKKEDTSWIHQLTL